MNAHSLTPVGSTETLHERGATREHRAHSVLTVLRLTGRGSDALVPSGLPCWETHSHVRETRHPLSGRQRGKTEPEC